MFQLHYPAASSFYRKSCNTGGIPLAWPAAQGVGREPGTWKEYHGVPLVSLPDASLPAVPLDEAIRRRVSCRRFGGAAIGLGELATLLAGSYGVLGHATMQHLQLSVRPIPSGGARYPLELSLLVRRVEGLDRGVYHYNARSSCLAPTRGPLPWTSVIELFMDQRYLAEADAIVVMTAVIERTMARYGERGFRLILMECGHLAQSLNLLAAAIGLGSLNLGGFCDEHLAATLGLDMEVEVPLYAVAVGRPTTTDLEEMRNPTET